MYFSLKCHFCDGQSFKFVVAAEAFIQYCGGAHFSSFVMKFTCMSEYYGLNCVIRCRLMLSTCSVSFTTLPSYVVLHSRCVCLHFVCKPIA